MPTTSLRRMKMAASRTGALRLSLLVLAGRHSRPGHHLLAASNSSIGLPDGSSSKICLPPMPATMSLRK